MKLTLEPPGAKHSKVTYHKLLAIDFNFALNFNLRP